MDEQEHWFTGYPNQQGWFDVLIDGELDRARHWICSMSGRHEWVDVDGAYIRDKEVLWTGEPSVRYM